MCANSAARALGSARVATNHRVVLTSEKLISPRGIIIYLYGDYPSKQARAHLRIIIIIIQLHIYTDAHIAVNVGIYNVLHYRGICIYLVCYV